MSPEHFSLGLVSMLLVASVSLAGCAALNYPLVEKAWRLLFVAGVLWCSAANAVESASVDRLKLVCPAQALDVDAAIGAFRNASTASNDNRSALQLFEDGEKAREDKLYDDAQSLFVLAIDRALNQGAQHQAEVASSLIALGRIFQWRSRYGHGKAVFDCSAAYLRQHFGEAAPAIAMAEAHLAEFESVFCHPRALEHCAESERIFRDSIRDLEVAGEAHRSELAFAVSGLANLYIRIDSRDPRALTLYRKAISLYESDPRCGEDCLAKVVAKDNLGQHLTLLGQYEEAEQLLSQALAWKEYWRGPAHDTTATSANALARLYAATDPAKALGFHRRAVFIVYAQSQEAATPDSAVLSRLAELSSDLARFLDERNDPALAFDAVFFYKLSVNARQQMRAGVASMDTTYREALTQVVADTYYRLARLLAVQGRIQEAEQVLLALKDAEFIRFVRGAVEVESSSITLTTQEQQLRTELDALGRRLAKGYATLNDARIQAGSSAAAYTLAQAAVASLQLELSQMLDAVSARLRSLGLSTASRLPVKDSRLARIASTLSDSPTGEPVVIVTYLPEKRLTTVIVTAASGTTVFPLAEGVGTEILYPLITEMRQAIRTRTDFQAPARALYEKLVAPVRAHMQERGLAPKMIMLYLTDRLRLLPFAALQDGSGNYLIESYRLSTLSPASLSMIDKRSSGNWSVQAFGTSIAAGGLDALPAVKDELMSIVRTDSRSTGTLPGREFLDEKFTRAAFQEVLQSKPGTSARSVIHVATHFSAPAPGEGWQNGFLQLGSGERFRVSETQSLRGVDLSDVELLTLSACSTEVMDGTDGSEFEGLGMVFQTKGAQAVISTLWAVTDPAGSVLMKSFYASRGAQRMMSKADALQRAQIAMIRGQLEVVDHKIDVSHPYYWAPFVLIGNWQ